MNVQGENTSGLCELAPHSFIYELRNALAPETCRDMIVRFEAATDQQYEGRIGQQQDREQSIKRSTDLRISGRGQWRDIDAALLSSLSDALGTWSSS